MSALHMAKVALALRVELPADALARHVAASAEVVGAELARQVQSYASQHGLGYYPPLDFLRSQNAIEPELLDAVEQLSWVATNMAREELRVKLRPVFASVRFEAIQSLAYTMPTVRPGQINSFAKLAEHFTPTSVKVDLLVSMLQKGEREGVERLAEQMARRWSEGRFASLQVTAVRGIP